MSIAAIIGVVALCVFFAVIIWAAYSGPTERGPGDDGSGRSLGPDGPGAY